MVIAVNTKYFLKAYQDEYSKLMYDYFSRIANQHKEHTFIFFSDKTFDPSLKFGKNTTPISITPKMRAGIFSTIFYSMKIASVLKKQKANVFINADGFSSLFTKVPQLFILHNPAGLSRKQLIKKSHLSFYKKCLLPILKRVKIIVAESQFSKNYIIQKYQIKPHKCDVIFSGVSELPVQIDWEKKEKLKTQYAEGNEYFLFYGDTSQIGILLNLLKAFSHFKKWQKSSMQLLIANKGTVLKDLTENLKSFKYRKDIKLLSNLLKDEYTKVVMAAYSTIYFPLPESVSFVASQAMSCNMPLVTSDKEPMPEIFGEAALYANFNDPVNIADKLILLFKDEKLRAGLIENGKKPIQKYNWEKVTGLLWQSILKANG